MKINSSIPGLRVTAWAVAASISLSLAGEAKAQNAARLAAAAQAQSQMIANNSAEAGLLREAYGLLAAADHDYKGNRAKAMRQIEIAAKQLGVNLHGDGKVREPQTNSDAQLRSAEALLVQASPGLSGQGLAHIKLAVEHLNVALAIR
jgi:hypothetical protein